jgi:hypothetical protein
MIGSIILSVVDLLIRIEDRLERRRREKLAESERRLREELR